MNERRVVITGMGVVSPVGNDLAAFWESLKAGRSGIGQITAFDTSQYHCHIGGEVRDFDYMPFFKSPRDGKRCDRYVGLGMAASKMAISDAGLDLNAIDPTRVGVMVGSGIGGLSTLEREHTVLIQKAPNRVSPFVIPMMISNMASGMVSMEFSARGPNMSVVSACSTANHSIGESFPG